MSRRLSAWLFCTLSVIWFPKAEGVDRQWSQLSGVHNFDDAGSWTPSGIPSTNDNVTFGLDVDVDVILGLPSRADDLSFTDGVVEFLDSGGATLNNSGSVTIDDVTAAALADAANVTFRGDQWTSLGNAFVGDVGRGTLSVFGGSDFTAPSIFIGLEAGSEGEVNVSDAGSTIMIAGAANVASRGTGRLTISDGAVVQIETLQISKEAPGDGTVTVAGSSGGAPSTLQILERMDLGDPDDSGGTATLNINSGGRVSAMTAAGGFRVAGAAGGTATIHVAGVGSLFESDATMLLGYRGDGTLNVNAAAMATSANVTVGQLPSSTGTANIAGLGAAWSVSEKLLVGDLGDGHLNVTGGGMVNAKELFVGDGANSTGAANVTIDGNGSTVNVAERTEIGVTHAANLTISGGGVLNTSTGGDFDFAVDQSQQGSGSSVVTVDGAGSQLNHQGTGRLNVGTALVGDFAAAARLNVTNGGVVTTRDLEVSFFGPSRGIVTASGAGSRIDARNNISIGSQGEGTLIVESGGVVAAQNRIRISEFRTIATATVTGVGSELTAGATLGVAAFHNNAFNGFATGTLTIADGGTVSNAGNGQIAGATRNIATVHVGDGGAPATWNNGASLIVGNSNSSGSATLNVNAGGIVNVTDALDVNLNATVNLDGGEINVGTLVIADPDDFNFNTGTLRLTGDETLDAAAYMQYFAGVASPTLGANRHLAVTGAATLTAPITLDHATAALSIGSTGDLSNVNWNAGTLNLTSQNLAIGVAGLLDELVTLNQDKSLGVPNNQLFVEPLANLNVVGGGLRVGDAANHGRIFISDAAAIDFDADTNGAGLVNHEDLVIANSSVVGDVLNQGDFDVAGEVALAGNLSLDATGSINFLIGDSLPGEFGSLAIIGDVALAGELDITLTGGFAPTEGDVFDILSVEGSLTGMFTGLPDGALVGNFGGTDLFVDYDAGDGNDVALFAAADVDLDDDGDVDGVDFLLIQRTNLTLISQWQLQYGSVSQINAFTSGVPEPASVVLLVVGLGFVACSRRKTPQI